ncbi:hypothetical protein HY407_03965 [Candidatus Gottesmanbacteria bacterium]|nr:hypothetical protein [Candidatus Gottesmanbacteria bacterium]
MPVKRIIGGSLEFIKDTAKKGAQIAPDILGGMLEQAVKGSQQTPAQKQQAAQQMQQKQTQHQQKDEEELKKAREALAQLQKMQKTFAPKPQQAPRPYEATISDMEQKKAQEVEALKRQQSQALPVPMSKQSRGMLFKKKKVNKGSEGLVKDTRVG